MFCKYGGSKLVRELQPNSKYCTRVRMYEYNTTTSIYCTCMKHLESANTVYSFRLSMNLFSVSVPGIHTWLYPLLPASTLACIHSCLYPLLSLSTLFVCIFISTPVFLSALICIHSGLYPLLTMPSPVNIHFCQYPLLSVSFPVNIHTYPFCEFSFLYSLLLEYTFVSIHSSLYLILVYIYLLQSVTTSCLCTCNYSLYTYMYSCLRFFPV